MTRLLPANVITYHAPFAWLDLGCAPANLPTFARLFAIHKDLAIVRDSNAWTCFSFAFGSLAFAIAVAATFPFPPDEEVCTFSCLCPPMLWSGVRCWRTSGCSQNFVKETSNGLSSPVFGCSLPHVSVDTFTHKALSALMTCSTLMSLLAKGASFIFSNNFFVQRSKTEKIAMPAKSYASERLRKAWRNLCSPATLTSSSRCFFTKSQTPELSKASEVSTLECSASSCLDEHRLSSM